MPLACPYCAQTINVQDATRPGRFRMECPACERAFAIIVGDAPDYLMTVRPIEVRPSVEPEAPVEASSPSKNASALWGRVQTFVAERWRWVWRAVSHQGSVVGGAILLDELGRTSRGTLARGRHLLLGRNVLIRLLPSDWGAPDLVSLAKANREAYVSGEIVHPNLIRRLDTGQDRSRRYVIEEAVESPILASLAARSDWQGGDAALPIILHAARGLLAAHEQGVAHGDPSPENIGIDAGGVVKLTGLGWGQVIPETRDGLPPFAQSAAMDAQRLGLTLEAMAFRHSEGVNAPSGLARAVADKLKAVGTSEGYRDLSQAVHAIEAVLGVTPGGSFLPRDEEVSRLLQAVERYHASPLARLRFKLVLGFVGIVLLFLLLFIKVGNLSLVGGTLGFLGMTTIVYTLTRAGVERRGGLFGRVRELVLGGRRVDWLTIIAILSVALIALFYLGWLAGWLALLVVSAMMAIGFLVAIDVPIVQDREAPLADARALLAAMRSRGVSENSLREFVCKFGGVRWEELFEALFGLDETRRARLDWGHTNPGRFRWDAWRFPVLDWIDARLRARRESRARERFERLEEAAAIARKINDMTARRKSRRIAEALIVVGREVRQASLDKLAPASASIGVIPRTIPDLLREAVETPDKLLTSTDTDLRETGPNPILRLLAMAFGPRLRFFLGVTLLAAFVLWADQVKVASLSKIRSSAEQALADRDVSKLQAVNVDLDRAANATLPLDLPGVPSQITRLIVGYGVGTAGLILLASALIQGSMIAAFAVPGALIAWFGPRLGLPAVGPLTSAALSSAIGVSLLGLGILLVRNKNTRRH